MNNTYILTKDGITGLARTINEDGITFNPIYREDVFNIVRKTKLDDLYCQDTNLVIIRSKAKQLRREIYEELTKYQNIVFDFNNILYFNGFNIYSYSNILNKLSKILKVYNLSFVHLKNLDAYVILDLEKAKNKNIEIKSTSFGIPHIIGRRGSNINEIKEKIGVKNISIKEMEYEEFDLKKEEIIKLLKNLRFFLTKTI